MRRSWSLWCWKKVGICLQCEIKIKEMLFQSTIILSNNLTPYKVTSMFDPALLTQTGCLSSISPHKPLSSLWLSTPLAHPACHNNAASPFKQAYVPPSLQNGRSRAATSIPKDLSVKVGLVAAWKQKWKSAGYLRPWGQRWRRTATLLTIDPPQPPLHRSWLLWVIQNKVGPVG